MLLYQYGGAWSKILRESFSGHFKLSRYMCMVICSEYCDVILKAYHPALLHSVNYSRFSQTHDLLGHRLWYDPVQQRAETLLSLILTVKIKHVQLLHLSAPRLWFIDKMLSSPVTPVTGNRSDWTGLLCWHLSLIWMGFSLLTSLLFGLTQEWCIKLFHCLVWSVRSETETYVHQFTGGIIIKQMNKLCIFR